MNPALLQAGDDYIRTQCPSRYSYLVFRNGYLVWEQYYHGMSRTGYAEVMSVSESVLSLLLGQAIDSGRIESHVRLEQERIGFGWVQQALGMLG